MVETISFAWRNLPHWLVADRPYFVTLHLSGTLPRHVTTELAAERQRLLDSPDLCRKPESVAQLQRQHFTRIESILDAARENRHWLTSPEVAQIAMDSLHWLESHRGWRIYAATILSTHVHIVLRNLDGRNAEIMTDLARYKSFTGRMANKILGRSGAFWARDSFDHWCRNDAKVLGAIAYVKNNPVKAGLVEHWAQWKWTHIDPDFIESP